MGLRCNWRAVWDTGSRCGRSLSLRQLSVSHEKTKLAQSEMKKANEERTRNSLRWTATSSDWFVAFLLLLWACANFGVPWKDKIRIRLTCNKIKYVSDKSNEEVYGQTNAGRIDERRLYVSAWRRKGKNYWWSRWKIGFFQIQIENLKWWQDLNRK